MERQIAVISALVEGNSIRATVRMTGVAKDTVIKLLAKIGQACAEYQDKTLRNLPCKFGYGDVWTWTALCADTKIVPCWRVGGRDAWNAQNFMHNLASRLANRVQLTTDGHRAYLTAVEVAFGTQIDYAMLVKLYGNEPQGPETRYSPAQCIGAIATPVVGNPDRNHISTSYVERQNLSMRMHMRRFTRLTNAFSKKVENHEHALALYFMYYNFCRVHQTLRVTPAMEAGVSDHVWELREIVKLIHSASEKAA